MAMQSQSFELISLKERSLEEVIMILKDLITKAERRIEQINKKTK